MRPIGDHSSGTALADRLTRPTRMEREGAPVPCGTPIPIRSCSRRGLPCHPCHQERGGLLPHPFTLTPRTCQKTDKSRGGLLSVALSLGLRSPILADQVASPGGRYPPPCLRGARTFLQQVALPAAARPPDRTLLISPRPEIGDSSPDCCHSLRRECPSAAKTALRYGLFR